uniref:P53 apoptosis effector related to pmp22 n=1 Tax=Eptatretus burgeri TaxID=7764 RepID=A0A8C4QIR8_EPTBU
MTKVLTIRPFPLIGLTCLITAAVLAVLALADSPWVNADHYSLSLWQLCKLRSDIKAWHCTDARTTDWKVWTIALMFLGLIITIVCALLALWTLCKGSNNFNKIIGALACIAVLLQLTALILYAVRFVHETVLHTYHEFAWGYGIGWGSTIFLIGAAVFFFLKSQPYHSPKHINH